VVVGFGLIREIRRLDESDALKWNTQYLDFAQVTEQRTILPEEESAAMHRLFVAEEVSAQCVETLSVLHDKPFKFVKHPLWTTNPRILFPGGNEIL
jgi:hypothetical protein